MTITLLFELLYLLPCSPYLDVMGHLLIHDSIRTRHLGESDQFLAFLLRQLISFFHSAGQKIIRYGFFPSLSFLVEAADNCVPPHPFFPSDFIFSISRACTVNKKTLKIFRT